VDNNSSDMSLRGFDDYMSVMLGFLNDDLSLVDFDSQCLDKGDLVHSNSSSNQSSDMNDNSLDTSNSDDDLSHDDLNSSDNDMNVTDCFDFVYMDLDTVFVANVDGVMDNMLGLVGNMDLVVMDGDCVFNDDLLDDDQMMLSLGNSLLDY
jgi:hypothetical protein